jgi:F-type H+-transporting ATPase subunit a
VTALALSILAAQAEEAAEHAAGQGAETAGHAEGAHDAATVLMHHVLDAPFLGFYSKHLIFFVLAALVVIVLTRIALASYKKGVPSGTGALVELFVVFIRDDIADKNIGHEDGRKFTPLLCTFFFFILVAALMGLLPFSSTSTGNIAVTMALAAISFGAQQWAGISKYGFVRHFKGLIPPGIPWPLIPLMAVVEFISIFTKPFALMIRLFANMLAGHMVITALLLLIPLMAAISTTFGILIIPVSVGLSLFIMLLELLVALIQAYIFTLLTSIFIGMYAHPAH